MTAPRYLLDSSIVTRMISGFQPALEQRVRALSPDDWAISVVTRAELLAGLLDVPADHPAHDVVGRFLEIARVPDWDRAAAEAFAGLHHLKTETGAGLNMVDLMVAAHAVSLGAILVTTKGSACAHLSPPLRFENWVDAEG